MGSRQRRREASIINELIVIAWRHMAMNNVRPPSNGLRLYVEIAFFVINRDTRVERSSLTLGIELPTSSKHRSALGRSRSP